MATYSLFVINGLGSFILILYGLAFLIKAVNLVPTLLCPICIVRMKLRWCSSSERNKAQWDRVRLNNDFEHYRDEFDFNAEDEREDKQSQD